MHVRGLNRAEPQKRLSQFLYSGGQKSWPTLFVFFPLRMKRNRTWIKQITTSALLFRASSALDFIMPTLCPAHVCKMNFILSSSIWALQVALIYPSLIGSICVVTGWNSTCSQGRNNLLQYFSFCNLLACGWGLAQRSTGGESCPWFPCTDVF